MSRNGSGVYSLAAGNPVTTGTTISSSWANNTLSDIASALTGSIAADGQTVITANLPMSTYAHTAVGVATARTMYGSAGQVQDSTLTYLTTIAGTNTITAVAPVLMSAYATGQIFHFIAVGANTGAVTVNINAIGAKSLKRTDGSALVSGDIANGSAVQVLYDGTNFQLISDSNGFSETVSNLTVTGTTTATGLITANGGVSGALNGTLGATTPSTVAATTIEATSTIKGATTISVGAATPSASGSGITFPATQSASTDANTLDDYEEGTYTPTITFNTSNGNLAYSVQVGRYTKIGNLVYVGGKIVFSQTTASSYLFMNNLPFAAKNVTNYFPSTGIGVTGMTGVVGGVVANVQANDVTAYPFTGTTGAYGVISASFCNGGTAEIDFGFTYLTN